MEKHSSNRFYRVFTNDTAVTEVSFNDFKPPVTRNYKKESISGNSVDELFSIPYHTYSLLSEENRYCGYEQKIHAMEMAKRGALKHIEELITAGPQGNNKVYQYRFDHYDDLNIHLTDSNIRRLKNLSKT
ncbi:MAG: hypothetical protein H7Y13_06190 [Sphingobacteriaceae bacterium]|nr:hypothetical protein [Sphingobacteriaceae bacterium]